MILGLVLIAMISAAAVSITLFLLSAPVWLVLLAYPLTGVVVMCSGLVVRDSRVRQWLRGEKATFYARVTARFRAGQRPR